MDLRIERTYKTLTDSLEELLLEKSFGEISVAELCDKAMIRRATFYKHFADKYEFFTFVFRGIINDFRIETQKKSEYKNSKLFYIGMIQETLDFVEKNFTLVQTMFKSKSAYSIMDILAEEAQLDISLQLEQNLKEGESIPVSACLLSSALTGSIIYTIRGWVLEDMKTSKTDMIDFCKKLLKQLK